MGDSRALPGRWFSQRAAAHERKRNRPRGCHDSCPAGQELEDSLIRGVVSSQGVSPVLGTKVFLVKLLATAILLVGSITLAIPPIAAAEMTGAKGKVSSVSARHTAPTSITKPSQDASSENDCWTGNPRQNQNVCAHYHAHGSALQVPEPTSLLLVGVGLVSIATLARRRYRRQSE